MNKKDRIPYYLFRNAFITFIVAFISFMISIMSYYQCSIVEGIQRLFFLDIYTTLYFLLIWLLDYIIFEISKILYDEYGRNMSYKLIVVFVILAILIYLLPIFDIFQYDFIILCILIIFRIIKEMIKKTN